MSTKKGMKLNKTKRGGPRTFSTPEEISNDVRQMNIRRQDNDSDSDEPKQKPSNAAQVFQTRNPNDGGPMMPESSDSEQEEEQVSTEPQNRKERF